MELTKIVTSLETSKKLKKLGVEQESLFYYSDTRKSWKKYNHYDTDEFIAFNEVDREIELVYGLEEAKELSRSYNDSIPLSAFTTSELAEMLTQLGCNFLPYFCDNPKEMCWVYNFGPYPNYVRADTLVECLAKMLIHLKENKLI